MGGRISPFPINLPIGLYNSLYYRTSRDVYNHSLLITSLDKTQQVTFANTVSTKINFVYVSQTLPRFCECRMIGLCLRFAADKLVDWKWRTRKWRTKKMKERKYRTENARPNVRGRFCRIWKCGTRKPGPENGRPTAGSWLFNLIMKKCDEKLLTYSLWVWRRMLRISRTERKTNTWIREKIGLSEEKGILEQIKYRKLSKYCHWKRRSDSVVLATIEGEIEGKCFPGRRRTACMNRRCSAVDRRWHERGENKCNGKKIGAYNCW